MAKKKFFWQREKEYYEFPLWLRIPGGIVSAVWMAVKVALGAAILAFTIICVTGSVFAYMLGDYLQDEVAPNAELSAENFNLDLSSFIYYVDSNDNIREMQQINTEIDRIMVPFEEIPEDLVHAAVAIEDKRFYEHQGVDWFTTTKACINLFLGQHSTFGGSTITQQLIKNVTEDDDVTVRRKMMEIFRAVQFEENYTKDEIMEWYLNTIYLGEHCYGVQTAARTYFGKDVKDLTAAECASLISITNNPSLYDPYISMERNRKRQLLVLDEMHKQGYLTDQEYQEAVDQKMIFTSVYQGGDKYTCPNCGLEGSRGTFDWSEVDKVYYCPNCGEMMDIPELEESFYTYFDDTIIRDVCRDLMEKYGYTEKVCMEMIKTGGYHIYATIDMDIQNVVDSVYQDLSRIPTTDSTQQLQSAIVVIDNATGDIVGMAGGVGKKDNYLGWNRATQSTLQPGSSIKPISVYSPAMEAGLIHPGTVLFDGPLYDDYPKNYDWIYSGYTNILDGVSQSMNTIACRVVDMIGPKYSFDFAKDKFGISTLIESEMINGSEKSDVDIAPMAMGAMTYGVTVRNLATAYGTFTNNGVWREARTYTKVLDSNGNVVLDNTQDSRQILSKKTVDYMNYMLNYAVSDGSPATFPGMSCAGKTGTTSDDNDRWFAGFTPYYTAVVWCGYDQPETIRLTGNYGNPSARLWRMVMEPIHAELPDKDLFDYNAMRTVQLCTESGKLATDACRSDPRPYSCVMNVRLYPEDIPTESCDVHAITPYCVAGQASANAFCALHPGNLVVPRGLVKMTDEMKKMYESAGINVTSFIYPDGTDAAPGCQVHGKLFQPDPTEDPEEPTEEPEENEEP